MTGTPPRTHGDRIYDETLPMPPLPTLAQTFRDAGYQAYAVGKLHVFPPRDRIGFDDVILDEQGRLQFGSLDDYEIFLGDRGYVGQSFGHGMSTNEFWYRPWHLPEDCHVTNWASQQMARTIKRRDPTRPAFWYLSYCHPHPPLVPLQCYLDFYRDMDPGSPAVGEWAADTDAVPSRVKSVQRQWEHMTPEQISGARRAFYALCTHIDHQMRLVIGTLWEEGILDNTIVMFTADHGHLLGQHRLWDMRFMYENSANVPMILMGVAGDSRVGYHRTDDRLVGLQDVMPTLLDLAGISILSTVEGLSLVGERRRASLYAEYGEGINATRMIHDGRFKLIYYAAGNCIQLFDLEQDPHEMKNLASSSEHAEIRERLSGLLLKELYGSDETWVRDGRLVGLPDQPYQAKPNRDLSHQRGTHWPVSFPPEDLQRRT
jgi:arylsulfatase A-like enzyme